MRKTDVVVIGAGAVLTKDTEPYGVYLGVPARLAYFRDPGDPVRTDP